MQPHLARRVALFDPPCQPRLAGQLHLGFENQLEPRLRDDHAPEVERVTRPQVERMASAAPQSWSAEELVGEAPK